MAFHHLLRAQAQPLGRPRREVLDEHVGIPDQPDRNLPRLRMFEVQREALLRSVQPDKVAGQSFHGLVVAAREVARTRTLDLDYPRPEVRELARREGRGDRLLERDDCHPLEWQHQYDLGRPSTCSAM